MLSASTPQIIRLRSASRRVRRAMVSTFMLRPFEVRSTNDEVRTGAVPGASLVRTSYFVLRTSLSSAFNRAQEDIFQGAAMGDNAVDRDAGADERLDQAGDVGQGVHADAHAIQCVGIVLLDRAVFGDQVQDGLVVRAEGQFNV